MNMNFNYKQRFYFLLYEILLLLVFFCFIWLGYDAVKEYMEFNDAINFAPLAVYCLFSPLFMLPLFYVGLYPIFKGVRPPSHIQKLAFKGIILGAVISLIMVFSFKIYFVHELNKKGYIECDNLPSSYTPGPGGATRYVLDRHKCDESLKDPAGKTH